MGVKNYQHYRLLGSSVRFRRKAVGATTYAWVDFGTMETTSPAIEPETIELEDGRTGIRQLVDKATTKISESYPLNINNLNLDNLAILFGSNAPEALTRAALGNKYLSQTVKKGALNQLEENGLPVHMATAIAGFYKGAVIKPVLTTIVKSTKTLTFSTDPAIAGAGEGLIVTPKGLANIGNAKTYTSAGASAGSGPYTVVVVEEPDADETAITGEAVIENGGDIYLPGELTTRSADDGTFLIDDASTVTDGDTVIVVCGLAALSGNRRLKPQDVKGVIEGEAIITFAEDNNDKLLVRYAPLVTITASGSTFQNSGGFSSIQLTLDVLSDLSSEVPAGYLDQIKGTLPVLT